MRNESVLMPVIFHQKAIIGIMFIYFIMSLKIVNTLFHCTTKIVNLAYFLPFSFQLIYDDGAFSVLSRTGRLSNEESEIIDNFGFNLPNPV